MSLVLHKPGATGAHPPQDWTFGGLPQGHSKVPATWDIQEGHPHPEHLPLTQEGDCGEVIQCPLDTRHQGKLGGKPVAPVEHDHPALPELGRVHSRGPHLDHQARHTGRRRVVLEGRKTLTNRKASLHTDLSGDSTRVTDTGLDTAALQVLKAVARSGGGAGHSSNTTGAGAGLCRPCRAAALSQGWTGAGLNLKPKNPGQ